MKQLAKHSETVYALLRIVVGLLFAFHGAQKLFGFMADPAQPHEIPVGSQIWIGGVIEFVGGLLVAAGFQTRLAAFLASGTMAVAYFQFHWPILHPKFGPEFFPGVNHGEPAVIYCFIFLYIACKGAGKWSFDKS
jgi:putative oxidoreductase